MSYFDEGSTQIPSQEPFLFLPAWSPNYLDLLNRTTSKVVIVWTSPLLQSEMVAQELEYVEEIVRAVDAGKVHAVWCGDPAAVSLFNRARVFYAPYPVSLPSDFRREQSFPKKNVSLFGPMHPRKNVLVQAVAARLAGVKLHLTDGHAVPVVRAAGADFECHGWLPRPSYEKLLMSMDAGLQVSVPGVESFSFVCWDHISRGIPCLTSVKWAPEHLQVKDPSDPREIAERLSSLALADLRGWAETFAEQRNEECRELLRSSLGVSL